MNQVRLVFQMQPGVYHDNRTKIGFIGSLLSGPALNWFAPYVENNAPILSDLSAFNLIFESTFGDPDKYRTAATKIRSLKQGNRSTATYASEFRQIASDLAWDDAALTDQFRSGLRDDVKDLMIAFTNPEDLTASISLAICCDNRLFEQRQERRLTLPTTFTPAPPSMGIPPRPTPTSGNDSMQLDAVRFKPLTNAEKDRHRANNLCLYCGLAGHMVRNCPRKLSGPLATVSVSENTQVQLQ